MSEPVVWLTIFILSVFVGVEVISKVSSTLHTPLMSGANAIHGIILLGAILVSGYATATLQLVIGLVAVVLASVNMVGGFVVTDRMLQMFTRQPTACLRRRSPGHDGDPGLGPAGLPGRSRLLHPGAEGPVLAPQRPRRATWSAPSARSSPAWWCSSTPTSTTSCRSWSPSRSVRRSGWSGPGACR